MILISLFIWGITAFLANEDGSSAQNCNLDSNCQECSEQDPSFCISCKPGFGLEKNEGVSTGKCTKCSLEFCTECADDFTKCTNCKSGYGLIISGRCLSRAL